MSAEFAFAGLPDRKVCTRLAQLICKANESPLRVSRNPRQLTRSIMDAVDFLPVAGGDL
jgi:hypothetical protein